MRYDSRQLRIEIREDVQVRAQRLAIVHIRRVLARPEEGLAARDALQSGQIDIARTQQLRVLLREIVSHHGHDLHVREVARGERDICGRAAQHAIHFSVRRFHAVICDRTNND